MQELTNQEVMQQSNLIIARVYSIDKNDEFLPVAHNIIIIKDSYHQWTINRIEKTKRRDV